MTLAEQYVIVHAGQEKDSQNQLWLILRVPSVDLVCFWYCTTQRVACQRSLVTFEERRCRFVNDVLHDRESGKRLRGRAPVEGPHGEMVVSAFADRELLFEVIKGIETVRSIGIYLF